MRLAQTAGVRAATSRAVPQLARLRGSLGSFTSLGVTVAVAGVVSWVLAVVTGWRELAIMACTCLVLVAAAVLSTLGKDELVVDLSLAQHRVVVGQGAVGTVQASNGTSSRSRSAVVEVPVGQGAAVLSVPALSSGDSHEDVFVIPADRRAILAVGPARTVRGDALGLARRTVIWTSATTLYVHPRTLRLPGTTSGWLRDMDGQSRNDLSSSDVVFHALREYAPGDDRRHIHWKTFARTGKLMVRQFVDSRKSELGLVLSSRTSEYASNEEYELAVSVVGSLGLSAFRERQEVACASGRTALPSYNEQRLLDSLAGVELREKEVDVLEAVQRAQTHLTHASVVVLVSGGAVNPAVLRAAADRCGAHARVIAVQVALGTPAASRRIGQHTLLTVGALEDLRRLTRTLAA